MAAVVVLNGTIDNGNAETTDLTRAGIGTPSAAIIIASFANAAADPANGAGLSVGFYDGTTNCAAGYYSGDNISTSATKRTISGTRCVYFYDSGASYIIEFAASWVTDGIRFTESNGSADPSQQIKVTVILFCGVDAKIGTSEMPTTGNTTSSGSLGFTPGAVFSVGCGVSASYTGNEAIISFGAATSDGSERCSLFFEQNNVSTKNVGQYLHTSAIAGQYYTGTLSWAANISAWNADDFSFGNVSGNPEGDDVYWLALDNTIDYELHTLTAPASTGSSAVSGLSINPDAVLVSMLETGATDTGDTSAANGICFGAADGTAQGVQGTVCEDGASTSNTASYSSSSECLNLDTSSSGTRSDLVDASVSSFGTGEYTLNYTATSSGLKGWGIAFDVGGTPPAATARNIIIGGGVL